MAKKKPQKKPFQFFHLAKITIAYLAVITAHSIWGINFVVAKLTLEEIPPMSLAFLRFSLATLLIAPFLIAERKKVKINLKDLPQLLTVGVLMVTLNIGLFYEGILRTTVIQASVLTLTIPTLSVLLGWWFLKEKVFIVNLIGIFMGLVGASVVIGASFLFGVVNNQYLLGNILLILASLCWVVAGVLSRPLLSRYSILTITAISFFVGTLTFFIPAANEYLKDPSWPTKLSALGILGLSYITILSSVCAFFLFEWGILKLGVYKANLFQYIEPLIATALGIIILSETPRFAFVIGAILIGLGVYWGTLGKEEHHKRLKAHRT